MAAQRGASALVLALLACATLALRTWLGAFQSTSAFTVVGSSPEGFAPPAHAPRAEIPRAPSVGKLGSDAGASKQVEVVSFNRYEYLRRKDMGYKYPVGDEAYQFPPPIPDNRAGMNFPSTLLAHCDRVYKKKWLVCKRLSENKRRQSDCEWDAFRWRRTCYWKARPNNMKIHPSFNKDHPWNKQA